MRLSVPVMAGWAVVAICGCARGELGGDVFSEECTWATEDKYRNNLQDLQGLGITTDATQSTVYAVAGLERGGPTIWELRSQAPGQPWKTVYADPDPQVDLVFGITRVEDTLYVIGNKTGSCPAACAGDCTSGVRQWVVRRSDDGGATWSIEDEYEHVPGAERSVPFAITADAQGNLWVAGYGYTGCSFDQASGSPAIEWVVRKRDAKTQTWSTVDKRNCASDGGFSSAYAVLATESGVYVAGACAYNAAYTDSRWKWQVRKTSDGGKTWATVDDWALATGKNAVVSELIEHKGALFAVGYARDKGRVRHWIVRKSTDGTTWETVDDYRMTCGGSAAAIAIGTSATGNLYVVGTAKDEKGSHWVARASRESGLAWKTIDKYQLVAGENAAAIRMTRDSTGRIIVTGRANNGSNELMVVRSCQ